MNIFLILVSLLLLFILGYQRNKRAKRKVIHLNSRNCITCGACVKRCGHKVLVIVNDETGKYLEVKNPEKCTACTNCIAVCKFNALELVTRNNQSPHFIDTGTR